MRGMSSKVMQPDAMRRLEVPTVQSLSGERLEGQTDGMDLLLPADTNNPIPAASIMIIHDGDESA